MKKIKKVVCWLMLIGMVAAVSHAQARAGEKSITVLAALDAFENPTQDWKVQCGNNVTCELSTTEVAGKKELVATFTLVDPQVQDSNIMWLNMVRNFSAPLTCPGAEGVRVVISVAEEQGAYLAFGFLDKAKKKVECPASAVINKLGTEKKEILIPFSSLKSKDGGKIAGAEDILGFTFGGRAPHGAVTIHEITFYKKQ